MVSDDPRFKLACRIEHLLAAGDALRVAVPLGMGMPNFRKCVLRLGDRGRRTPRLEFVEVIAVCSFVCIVSIELVRGLRSAPTKIVIFDNGGGGSLGNSVPARCELIEWLLPTKLYARLSARDGGCRGSDGRGHCPRG